LTYFTLRVILKTWKGNQAHQKKGKNKMADFSTQIWRLKEKLEKTNPEIETSIDEASTGSCYLTLWFPNCTHEVVRLADHAPKYNNIVNGDFRKITDLKKALKLRIETGSWY